MLLLVRPSWLCTSENIWLNCPHTAIPGSRQQSVKPQNHVPKLNLYWSRVSCSLFPTLHTSAEWQPNMLNLDMYLAAEIMMVPQYFATKQVCKQETGKFLRMKMCRASVEIREMALDRNWKSVTEMLETTFFGSLHSAACTVVDILQLLT